MSERMKYTSRFVKAGMSVVGVLATSLSASGELIGSGEFLISATPGAWFPGAPIPAAVGGSAGGG